MSDYRALSNFLAAYFHQDWNVEHATPEAVVDYFLGNESDAQIAAVRHDLARLTEQDLDEVALSSRLRALGSEFDGARSGISARDWLQSLAKKFASA